MKNTTLLIVSDETMTRFCLRQTFSPQKQASRSEAKFTGKRPHRKLASCCRM